MRSKKLRYTVLVIYFVAVIFTSIILSGLVEIYPACDYFTNRRIIWPQMFIPFIVFPMVGYGISIILKIEKSKRFLFYLIIPIISSAFVSGYLSSKKKDYVHSSLCIVRIAKVKDTYWGSQTSYVDVSYRENDRRYRRDEVRFLGKSEINTIRVGDSLLVISVVDCDAIMYVYKARPTSEEFLKCQDFGYFYDGKLYSKEEFEKK